MSETPEQNPPLMANISLNVDDATALYNTLSATPPPTSQGSPTASVPLDEATRERLKNAVSEGVHSATGNALGTDVETGEDSPNSDDNPNE